MFASRVDHFPRWGVWPVLALAAIVRFVGLGTRSLWTDEGSTWTAASLEWNALLERCIHRDASPPLYYVLTSWALRLGETEASLRLVSMLASLAMVWLAYRLARLLARRGPATFAAAIVALSPFQVMYAQEARTYPLAGAFLLAGLLLFTRAFLLGRREAWIGYVIVSALGLYTQSIAALGITAQVAVLLWMPEARKRWKEFVAAQLAVGVLYSPWLWASASAAGHLDSSHWYIAAPEAIGVFKVMRAVLISPLPLVGSLSGARTPGLDAWLPRPLAWGALVLLTVVPLVGALDGFGRRNARASTLLLWAGWLLPIVAVTVLSLRAPLLMTRYFVFAGVPVAALVAVGVASLPMAALRYGWAIALLLVQCFGLWRYASDYTKEPWRQVAADIGQRSQAGRTSVLVPFDVDPFAFYNRDARDRVTAHEYSHPDEPFAARYTATQFAQMKAAARDRTRDDDEVWVVVRSPNNADRKTAAADAEAVAAEGRVLVERRRWDSATGPLRVARFARPAAPDTVVTEPAPPPGRRPRVPRPESAAR